MFARGLDVVYAVYPVAGGNWMVGAMPPEPHSFAQRLPLPAAWAGLQDEALVAACGIADAVFVHAKRFVAAARSREGAMAMARAAIRSAIPAAPDDALGRSGTEGAGTRAEAIAPAQPISLIITRAQRAQLRDRGYSDEAIHTMTPTQAHELLDCR